jgi:hypothetical protein
MTDDTPDSRNSQPVFRVADENTHWYPSNMRKLKREISAGCARFWAKRGMKEPGGGGFNNMDFGKKESE